MKKFIGIGLFIFALASLGFGQDCKCTKYPWTPDYCYDQCAPKLLINANESELIFIVGLNRSVAQRIVEFNKSRKVKSLEEYKKILDADKDEFKALRDKIESLEEDQIRYLQQPADSLDRKKLRLGLDELFMKMKISPKDAYK